MFFNFLGLNLQAAVKININKKLLAYLERGDISLYYMRTNTTLYRIGT